MYCFNMEWKLCGYEDSELVRVLLLAKCICDKVSGIDLFIAKWQLQLIAVLSGTSGLMSKE